MMEIWEPKMKDEEKSKSLITASWLYDLKERTCAKQTNETSEIQSKTCWIIIEDIVETQREFFDILWTS